MGEAERRRALEQIRCAIWEARAKLPRRSLLACAEAGYITGSALKIDGGIF